MDFALSPLEAPAIVATNARGSLTGDQRRALALDLFGEHAKQLAATLGWLTMCVVMLWILLPLTRRLLPALLTDNEWGRTPVTFGTVTVTLPLWTLLNWGLALFILAYVVAFAVQVKNLVAFLFLLRAVVFGRVESVVGEIWHPNRQPIAVFGGRLVRPWDAKALAGVASGRYRFYLLPRFDWLLSAQRLGDQDGPTPAEKALAVRYSLSAVNGFDPAALPENRAGRLTPGQAHWLRASAPNIGWRSFVIHGIAIAAGIGGVVIYGRDALQLGISEDRLGGIAGCLVWTAIWVSLFVKQFVDHAKHRRDAAEGLVLSFEGIVTRWEGWRHSSSDSSNTWVYRYHCGGECFEVSREAYRALADGLHHRAYCTPQSKQLVNIELVPIVENAARFGYDPASRVVGHR